jgi:hypothetical protein
MIAKDRVTALHEVVIDRGCCTFMTTYHLFSTKAKFLYFYFEFGKGVVVGRLG